MKGICLILLSCFTYYSIQAQNVGLKGSEQDLLQTIELMDGQLSPIHTSIKPYQKDVQFEYLTSWYQDEENKINIVLQSQIQNFYNTFNAYLTPYARAKQNQYDSSFLLNLYKTNNKPFLKYFYKTPANLFEYDGKDGYIRINPLLDLSVGKEFGTDDLLFVNRRGLDIQIGLGNKIFISSNIIESQSHFPFQTRQYIDSFQTIPGNGFYKTYKSKLFATEKSYDYLQGQGSISFRPISNLHLELGHGSHFIGDGVRSMLLSDFAAPYFYVSLQSRIWKFNLKNIFAELSAENKNQSTTDRLLDKKFMAAHYLSMNITKRLNIAIFESVIFSRKNNFELQYLNPVILYRTVEQAIGSPDNVMLGLTAKYLFKRHVKCYAQVLLDEFRLDQLITDNNGWWANKYTFQIGAQYINVATIPNLNLQVEYNLARPYTYSHSDSLQSYSHYHQSMAHPFGANFKEYILGIQYQVSKRWNLQTKAIFAEIGRDKDGLNYGSNILRPNDTFVQEFNNVIGQGNKERIKYARAHISYTLYDNLFIDLEAQYRNSNLIQDKKVYVLAGLRWNLDRLKFEY